MSLPNQDFPIKAYTKELPEHKGNRRIWIATHKLFETPIGQNLTYGYTLDTEKKLLTIESGTSDNRKVTVRSNGMPIIDICNTDITKLFDGIEKVTIVIKGSSITIEPLKEELERKRATDKLNNGKITFVDIFAGGGTLTEAMKLGGMEAVAAVDLEDKYLENYERNNPKAFTYNTSVTDMDIDLLPDASVIVGGIVCTDYSIAGISKKNSLGVASREAGLTGSLGFYFLECVKKSRCSACVIEEVVGFATSALRDMIVSVLQMMGYTVTEEILTASDFGGMTKRKRYCMVATIRKEPFVFPKASSSINQERTISDILDTPISDRVWLDKDNSKSIAYSLTKEQGHIEKGDGFRLARTYLNDTVTATITRGYYRNQLTNPILVHPEDEGKFSWFTPRELARLNGVPDSYQFPTKNGEVVKTVSGELIGQGVAVEPFSLVAKALVAHLKGEKYLCEENCTSTTSVIKDEVIPETPPKVLTLLDFM